MHNHDREENYSLYVLALEKKKYYVGITMKTPEERFYEHTQGIMAARWTQKYQPVAISHSENLGKMTSQKAEMIESKVVRQYMKDLGYNNVRGGDICMTNRLYKAFGSLYFVPRPALFVLGLVVIILTTILAEMFLFSILT